MGLNLMRIEDKLRPPAQIKREANRIVYREYTPGLIEIDKGAKAEKERVKKEQDAIMAVALCQPHRGVFNSKTGRYEAGSDDPRLSEPLGRFCADHGLRNELYEAGEEYGRRVREARIAMGLSAGQLPVLDAGGSAQTPEQIEARRELAESRLREARGILLQIDRRLPQAMTRVTADAQEPYARE